MKFTGTHVIGRKRARTLGFPTINLHDIDTFINEDGVYAAWATIHHHRFMATLFVGESPTFRDKEKTIELYLIGLKKGDIKKYHLEPLVIPKITVEVVRYLRPVIKFKTKKITMTMAAQNMGRFQSGRTASCGMTPIP